LFRSYSFLLLVLVFDAVFLVLDRAEEELARAENVNPFVLILLSLTSCACRSWFLGLQLLPLSCWLFFMSLTCAFEIGFWFSSLLLVDFVTGNLCLRIALMRCA
jgi:hypothetical protein